MIFYLGILFGLASYSDQCSAAVYDYAENMCYVEDAYPEDAVCSEYREYEPGVSPDEFLRLPLDVRRACR